MQRRDTRPGFVALSAALSSLVAVLVFLSLLAAPAPALAQQPAASSSSTRGTGAAPSSTQSPAPTATTAALVDYLPVRLSLPYNSPNGVFFTFTIPANTTTTTTTQADGSLATVPAAPSHLSISVSVCGGPAVPPYDVTNNTVVRALSSRNSAEEVRQRTLLRAFWTASEEALRAIPSSRASGTDPVDATLLQDATAPGPSADARSGISTSHLSGGASLVSVRTNRENDQLFTLGIWPPEDVRDVANGTWSVRVTASMYLAPEAVSVYEGISLDDTDWSGAIVTSRMFPNVRNSNNTGSIAPNVSVFVLPSDGPAALDPYFNSSICALEQAFERFNSSGIVFYNTSSTLRGLANLPMGGSYLTGVYNDTANTLANFVRTQVKIVSLSPSTNYSVWLRYTSPQSRTNPTGVLGSFLYPAIKLLTKSSPNCRLVSDLDFCPAVAYSIPMAPDLDAEVAIVAANLTIGPNMANFTRMIDTFPCGDAYFGSYSVVSTCDDCKNAYRDWLCAVVLPRCTDPVAPELSAASQTGAELTGAPLGTNTRLLPYIVNRNVNGSETSRQRYVDALLRPGTYGELLPCYYTCHAVSRACPPINGWTWTCPQWDISAQRDYGTFVDAGPDGVGADLNGGDGLDGGGGGGGGGNSSLSGPDSGFAPGDAGAGNWSFSVDGGSGSGSGSGGATNMSGGPGGGMGSSAAGAGGGMGGVGGFFSSRGDALARGAGQRWGGISRYVATDAFGNQYCNAMGIDLLLRQQNAGVRSVRTAVGGGAGGLAVALVAGAVVGLGLV